MSWKFTRKDRGLVACAVVGVQMQHVDCQYACGEGCTHHGKSAQKTAGNMSFAHCSDCSFLSQQCLLLLQDPEHGQGIPGSKIFVQSLDVDREQVAYLRVHALCQWPTW